MKEEEIEAEVREIAFMLADLGTALDDISTQLQFLESTADGKLSERLEVMRKHIEEHDEDLSEKLDYFKTQTRIREEPDDSQSSSNFPQ